MWPLIRDFFTVKAAAVRAIRVVVGLGGTGIATGQIPVPEEWSWVGWVLVGLAGAITGNSQTKTGLAHRHDTNGGS